MDKQEALDALDEMVSALRALLPGAESMGWDTGNARTAISNSEIILAHLTDPGYVRVPVQLLRDGGHLAGLCAEKITFDPDSIMDESEKRTYERLMAHKNAVRELLTAATKETSHE